MGGMETRECNGSVGVVQKQPVIRRMASFCAIWSIWQIFFCRTPVYHTRAPYVRTGRMIVWYTFHQLAKLSPRTEFPRMCSEQTTDHALIAMIFAW